MDYQFILTYQGNDHSPKVRILKENYLSEEIIPFQIEYFKLYGCSASPQLNAVVVLMPNNMGNSLEFKCVDKLCTFVTHSGIPAHMYLEEIITKDPSILYRQMSEMLMDYLMFEQQSSTIH